MLHALENMLANFRACFDRRLGFECDMEKVKDGQLICVDHDTDNRTTSRTGKVSKLSPEEIRRVNI